MAESPVSPQAASRNGQRKTVVREREYDLRSWRGVRTLSTVILAICGIIIAVLTAYYTAEASQDARISTHAQQVIKLEERSVGREKAVDGILGKFDKTLTEQSKLLRENSGLLIKVQTTQELMHTHLKELSNDVKKLGEK